MRQHLRLSFSLFLSSIGILAACATVGKPFEFGGPDSLKIGTTTRNDVLKQYGEPFRVGYDNGDVKWTYGYYQYRLFGDSDTKDLDVRFDAKGFVKDYAYSSSNEDEKNKVLHPAP